MNILSFHEVEISLYLHLPALPLPFLPTHSLPSPPILLLPFNSSIFSFSCVLLLHYSSVSFPFPSTTLLSSHSYTFSFSRVLLLHLCCLSVAFHCLYNNVFSHSLCCPLTPTCHLTLLPVLPHSCLFSRSPTCPHTFLPLILICITSHQSSHSLTCLPILTYIASSPVLSLACRFILSL